MSSNPAGTPATRGPPASRNEAPTARVAPAMRGIFSRPTSAPEWRQPPPADRAGRGSNACRRPAPYAAPHPEAFGHGPPATRAHSARPVPAGGRRSARRQREQPLPPMIGGMIDGKGGISGSSSGAAGFRGVMVRAMMTFCLILRPRCHGISAKILAEASNSTRAARISKITTVIRAARRVSVATGLPCGKRPLAAASGSGSNRTGGRSSP